MSTGDWMLFLYEKMQESFKDETDEKVKQKKILFSFVYHFLDSYIRLSGNNPELEHVVQILTMVTNNVSAQFFVEFPEEMDEAVKKMDEYNINALFGFER